MPKDHISPLRKYFSSPQARCLALTAAAFLVFNACLRVWFTLWFTEDFSARLAGLPGALLAGLGNDLPALVYIMLPATLLIMLPSANFFNKRSGRIYLHCVLFVFFAVFIFTACSEHFFWDEFHTRFNFIAVDYLVYTSEVIGNIRESYPIAPLLAGIGLLALALTLAAGRLLPKGNPAAPLVLRKRLGVIGLNIAAGFAVFLFFAPHPAGADKYWQDTSRNGVYELFSAFWHNSIDYRAFYPQMDTNEAFALERKQLAEPSASFVSQDVTDLRREINSVGPATKPNVIVVVMESMGSKWLGEYSPNLVRLSEQGLSFSRMQATGTRTVRGLEAVTLSVPPTPGNSIVRRPGNSELFSLGSVFKDKGYDRAFIYGGYGYFDNMNGYFSGNGYRIVDRTDFPESRKTFATSWGQCDEDLFAESVAQADADYAAGTPFHQVVLTTSNHRPFTYPDGKIDIPSGSSRRGAVKYSDYAIGRFMEEAGQKPWFDNTIFIFVGDHPSAIAGKTDVPADAYGVVSFMYAPKLIKPQVVDTLCSQIDLAPTLFALMGWDYRSQFFGRDALAMRPEEGRAWISTYQLLGYLDTGGLTVLRPAGKAGGASATASNPADAKLPPDEQHRLQRAIASYQCAYDLFTEGKMHSQVVEANIPTQSPTDGHVAAAPEPVVQP